MNRGVSVIARLSQNRLRGGRTKCVCVCRHAIHRFRRPSPPRDMATFPIANRNLPGGFLPRIQTNWLIHSVPPVVGLPRHVLFI